MISKPIPFTIPDLASIISTYPTPFHLYEEMGIRKTIRHLNRLFSWNKGFKEYFAVKATPNPHILHLLAEEGCGADCSSLPELLLAEKVGITGSNIMFTSNDTPWNEYQKAFELGALLNIDDISHLPLLEGLGRMPEILCFRYNPGSVIDGSDIIGKPEEAKYGIPKDALFKAYRWSKDKGTKRFGLHTMLISNELNVDTFVFVAEMMFDVAVELYQTHGIGVEFINLGGGIGIPYRPEQKPMDLEYLSQAIQEAYQRFERSGTPAPKLFFEMGRMITGPHGVLVTQVMHIKQTYKNYIGVDACMADLMRPALYGAYHHITVLGKEHLPHDRIYDVTGSLCENNDKFAINRSLPNVEVGDILVIHDTGAHGHAMGFNYNGKLRSAELLLKPDGSIQCIRRAETIHDYFATLDFSLFR